MPEISFLREYPREMEETLKKRGMKEMLPDLKSLLSKDKEWRKLRKETDLLRRQRNEITQRIKIAKATKKDTKPLLEKAKKIPVKIKENEAKAQTLKTETDSLLIRFPNTLHKSD